MFWIMKISVLSIKLCVVISNSCLARVCPVMEDAGCSLVGSPQFSID